MYKKKHLRLQVNKYATGGGPEMDSKLDDIDLRAIDVCKGQFQPMGNTFDDDAGFHGDCESQDNSQEQYVRICLYCLLMSITCIVPLVHFAITLHSNLTIVTVRLSCIKEQIHNYLRFLRASIFLTASRSISLSEMTRIVINWNKLNSMLNFMINGFKDCS